MEQRKVFDTVYSWSMHYTKNLMFLHLFIAVGAGVDKLFLTEIFYQTLTELFYYRNSTFDKPKLFFLVPTNVAAVSINGTTIHSALHKEFSRLK